MHFYLTKQYYLILLLKKIKLKNNDVQAYSKGCFAQHTVILMMMLISAMFHKWSQCSIDAGIGMDQWIRVEVLDSDDCVYVDSMIELALPISQWR